MVLTIDIIPPILKLPAKNDTRMFPVKLQIRLDKEVRPLIYANKCIHIKFRDEVYIELQCISSKGITTSINKHTTQVSSIIYVRKRSDDIMICLDPDKAILLHHYTTLDDINHLLYCANIFSNLDACSGYIILNNAVIYLTTFNKING